MLEIVLATGLGLLMLANLFAFYLRVMGFPFQQRIRPIEAGIRLDIIPKSGMYSVLDESRLATNLLIISSWSGEVGWVADGQRCRTRREGFIRDRFFLEVGDVVWARAQPARIFSLALAIDYDGRRFTLRPRHAFRLFSSDLEVFEGGRLVGSFVRKGLFSGPGTAELPANLPKQINLFLVWLATMVWIRMAD